LLLLVLLTLGAGIWTSALAVRHRDFANALPVLLQIGLYASPVLYPIALVPASWRTVYDLNPMVGIIESLRWMLAPGAAFPKFGLLVSVVFAAVLFVSGLFYFRRVEDSISDLV
jgi:lipopolysaccharide transport system permease protein